MVTKSKKQSTGEKKGRVKVRKLRLNKETVKNLTGSQARAVKGGLGVGVTGACTATCQPTACAVAKVTAAGCNRG